jgi:hypothetical protein
MKDPLKFVYRLTNSQRMALCTFLVEYTREMLEPDSTLAQVSIDCTICPNPETTPTDLLNIFMDSSEIEIDGPDRRRPYDRGPVDA